MTTAPKLSIIIPSYNEETYIDRLLEDLTKQNYKKFEVIVSDADSEDDIKKVVESFNDKLDIKLVSSPPRGPGAGRNVGAKLAKGDWLLFMDADVDFDDDKFLETLLDKTEINGWSTASAKMTVNNWLNFRLGVWLFYRHQKKLAKTNKPAAQGYCILTKRKVFEELKGFNEKILLGEDNEYVERAGKYGFGFVEDTYYYVDLRRNHNEGWSYKWKAIANEWHRTHGGNPEDNKYAYEFGKHPKRKK